MEGKMNIKEIVAKYLKENGYDGLVNPDIWKCGCHLDDLMSCNEPHETECIPAISRKDKNGYPVMFPGKS
jgi:hypothetical protein